MDKKSRSQIKRLRAKGARLMNLKLKLKKKKPHYHFETWGFKLRLFILYPYSRVKGRMHIVYVQVKFTVAGPPEKSIKND